MRKSLWMVLALVVAGAVPAAHADTFDWSFTGADSGSGTFTATPISGTDYDLVTAISGTFNGQTITALLPTGTQGVGKTDNLIFPAGDAPVLISGEVDALLSFGGIGFSTGSQEWFLDSDGCSGPAPDCTAIYQALFPLGRGAFAGPSGAFTLTPAVTTPEPSSLALVPIGLAALLLIRKRAGHVPSAI